MQAHLPGQAAAAALTVLPAPAPQPFPTPQPGPPTPLFSAQTRSPLLLAPSRVSAVPSAWGALPAEATDVSSPFIQARFKCHLPATRSKTRHRQPQQLPRLPLARSARGACEQTRRPWLCVPAASQTVSLGVGPHPTAHGCTRSLEAGCPRRGALRLGSGRSHRPKQSLLPSRHVTARAGYRFQGKGDLVAQEGTR